MEEKKQGFFSKVKHWWKETLTEEDRDNFKIAGIYAFDGTLFGCAITTIIKNRKAKKTNDALICAGYIQGKLDAYKEMAQNPYQQIDTGFKRLEKQGKTVKF